MRECSGSQLLSDIQTFFKFTRYHEKYPKDSKYTKDGTNHFTQVVWKGSKRLCMATAMSADGEWYTVGRYAPAGNVMGQREENVPEMSSEDPDCRDGSPSQCPDWANNGYCNGGDFRKISFLYSLFNC